MFNDSEAKDRVLKNVSSHNSSQSMNRIFLKTDILKRLSILERYGISRNGNLNFEEDEVLKEFENSVKPIEYCYQIKLPLNEHSESLQNNCSYVNQLCANIKRLIKNRYFYS